MSFIVISFNYYCHCHSFVYLTCSIPEGHCPVCGAEAVGCCRLPHILGLGGQLLQVDVVVGARRVVRDVVLCSAVDANGLPLERRSFGRLSRTFLFADRGCCLVETSLLEHLAGLSLSRRRHAETLPSGSCAVCVGGRHGAIVRVPVGWSRHVGAVSASSPAA